MPSLDQEVRNKIAHLHTLERHDLVEAWTKAYGAPPFKGVRRSTLTRGLAYGIQCKSLGGLKPRLRKRLLKLTCADKVKSQAPLDFKVKQGSRIVREWNGRTHNVHVTDKGFVLSGVTYSSLSAAAKAITGTHQSGPRFFGVRN